MTPDILVEFTPRSVLYLFAAGAIVFGLLSVAAFWTFVRLRQIPREKRRELLGQSVFFRRTAVLGPLIAPVVFAASLGGTYVELGDFCRLELRGQNFSLCGPITCQVVNAQSVRSLRVVETRNNRIHPVIGAAMDPDSSWRVELTHHGGQVQRSCKLERVDGRTRTLLRQMEARPSSR